MTTAICKVLVANLRFTVTKPKRTATAGDDGYIDLSDAANWELHCTVRSKLMPRTGREAWAEQQTIAVRGFDVEMWLTSQTNGIQPDYRMTYVDKFGVTHVLQVQSNVPSADGKFTTIACLEAVT